MTVLEIGKLTNLEKVQVIKEFQKEIHHLANKGIFTSKRDKYIIRELSIETVKFLVSIEVSLNVQ